MYLQEALKASPINVALLAVDPWMLAYKICREPSSYLLTEVMPTKPDRVWRAKTLPLLVVVAYQYELAGLDFFSPEWMTIFSEEGGIVFPILEEYEYTMDDDEEL